jgi:tRNA nucleotidyltransferase (CCA-adding enzyme)
MDIINLYDNYNSYFSEDFRAIFEICSKIALKNGYKIYLIGGLVRDMLLNQQSLDIDITVEGNAIDFVKIIEKEKKAKIFSIHKNFGTIKAEINGIKIDFASTRSENYPKKGHLPHVEKIGCSLEKDVLRRDFTINSLAMSLNKDDFGDLIDYTEGLNDLEKKQIRILHEHSFVDDPTRIIRALKYSSRFGFQLEENTLRLQETYLENVNYDMCSKRIKNELKKTFDYCTQDTFNTFINQKIYKLISKRDFKLPEKNIQNLIEIYSPKHPWLVYFGVIAVFEENELLDKFEFTKNEKNIILSSKKLLNITLQNDFEVYKNFTGQKLETLIILAILGQAKQVLHYLKDLAEIKLHITGKDLIKLGFKPSKSFADGFDFVLRKKLKNPTLQKEQELKLMKDYFEN